MRKVSLAAFIAGLLLYVLALHFTFSSFGAMLISHVPATVAAIGIVYFDWINFWFNR